MNKTSPSIADGVTTLNGKQDDAAPPNFASLEDVHRYVRRLSAREAAEDRTVKTWQMVERLTLLVVLAASVFTFYMLTVIEKIIALPHLDIPAVHITIRTVMGAVYE